MRSWCCVLSHQQLRPILLPGAQWASPALTWKIWSTRLPWRQQLMAKTWSPWRSLSLLRTKSSWVSDEEALLVGKERPLPCFPAVVLICLAFLLILIPIVYFHLAWQKLIYNNWDHFHQSHVENVAIVFFYSQASFLIKQAPFFSFRPWEKECRNRRQE